jgi:Bacterial protein of unknown function (DUF885)
VPSWTQLEKKVVDGFFRFTPGFGRRVGDHRFDGQVGDASASTIRNRVKEIDRQLTQLEGQTGLSKDQDIDRRSLMAQLRAQRFELTDLRDPFQNPLFYAGWGTELDVSCYIKRAYAPLPERLQSLRQHLLGYPGLLEAARNNLEASLPRPTLEVAVDAAEGFSQYLADEVRPLVRDDAETEAAIGTAITQLDGFTEFLRSRMAGAHDHYALGEARFTSYLRTRDLVTLDVPTLEAMAREDLERNTQRAREVASRVAADGIPQALDTIQLTHPTVKTLISETAAMLEGIRRFIVERDLLSIPSEVRCTVAPTPSFMSWASAALDSAGALETKATESYYYVTVPTPDWGADKAEEWLRYLNYAVLENVSIHEAYPGHYVQALHERNAGSLTRRLFWVQSTGEGWAHYCEQMMLEEGYKDDPRLELAQLMDALLRDCRFLVSLGLHCGGMTMDDAIHTFMEKGFQSELPAQREATRGAFDPLYLNYTLGKLLIYEVRRKAEQQPDFALKSFHDRFLHCGNLPIPLIAELV